MPVFECDHKQHRQEWMPLDDEMAELTLLIPPHQMWALEQAADEHGMTIGKFVRSVLSQFAKPQFG